MVESKRYKSPITLSFMKKILLRRLRILTEAAYLLYFKMSTFDFPSFCPS